jgi:transcription termination factor NusB
LLRSSFFHFYPLALHPSFQESERKAYNPRPFCKTYTMDKQPLNTGEQKDMTEFFTDLITKIEEMSQDLKNTVKTLFGGVITNNVVSLVRITILLLKVYLQRFPGAEELCKVQNSS